MDRKSENNGSEDIGEMIGSPRNLYQDEDDYKRSTSNPKKMPKAKI